MTKFQLWSTSNNDVLKDLKPNFGFRSWGQLSPEEKHKIWKYLENHFFDKDLRRDFNRHPQNEDGKYYEFYGDYSEQQNKRKRVYLSIFTLNDLYKAKSYATNFLENQTPNNACNDFYFIFSNENENVVLELLSLYCRAIISERVEETIYKNKEEEDKEYSKRLNKWRWEPFDEFAKDVNEVFSHFGLNVYLTRLSFGPRQEEKILNQLIDPVLTCLSHENWKEVNKLLSDAFSEYRKNTSIGFSSSVTNSVAAVQAFLQILVKGKTGSGDISKLISQAQNQNLIPQDSFTKEVFKNIESILMKERQETGIAHPKKDYASDKNARLVLNLTMIFLQHCIQN